MSAGPLPLGLLISTLSEPPIAVLGLQAGTLASYSRPYQPLHFYDKSAPLKELVLPPAGKPRPFHYLHDALGRGCAVKVLVGDERATFAQHAPDRYYQLLVVETSRAGTDNIDVDLLTREAMILYFAKLADQGILCMHVSNRQLNLTPVVTDLVQSLGYAARHARDSAPMAQPEQEEDRGRMSSEWVMVARKQEYLRHLQDPPGSANPAEPFWRRPTPSGRPAWTDADAAAMGGKR